MKMNFMLIGLVAAALAVVNGDDAYNCNDRNPCTEENIAAGNFYFAADDSQYFVQCDAHGGCFVMPCGPGTEWDQEHLTCGPASNEDQGCQDGPVETDVVCQNRGWAVLTCADGSSLQINSANYGRTQSSSEVCPFYWRHADRTDCVEPSSEEKVREQCEGKQFCMLPSTDLYFTDSCPFTYKYLSITYQCVCDVPDTFDCDENNPCNADSIAENGSFYFPNHDDANFVQCDNNGGCFVMPCGADTVWSQDALTCVHA